MTLVLEANYAKKLGLPGYSSHQYSITVRTELSDVNQVEAESKRLYALLQTCVDREIQSTGFLPGQHQNGNGHHHSNGNGNGASEDWKCSLKQKELILQLVQDKKLSKTDVEQLSMKLFNLGVRSLNKLQASGLIGELTSTDSLVPPSAQRRPAQPRGFAGGRR
jgi:hypothetical protein